MKKPKMILRTDSLRDKNKKLFVDREKEIIEGFVVVQKGITHDRRGEFDDQELKNIVTLANEHKMGVKSRFGHPNMSSTALGTFLGRAKNYRIDGDVVRADLHLDSTAHKTPDGDLSGYVMDLAESDPSAFGSSMVISWDAEYYTRKLKDEETGEVREVNDYSKPPKIRTKKVFASDIVDDPAATDGMFGKAFFTESVMISSHATDFLDNLFESEDGLNQALSFLKRYIANAKTEQYAFSAQKVSEILEQYAKKRRGEEVEQSFDDITLDFKDHFMTIRESEVLSIDELKKKPFASELIEKFEDEGKEFFSAQFVKQWWKPKYMKNRIMEQHVLMTDKGYNIYISDNIFEKEESTCYFRESETLIGRFTESVEFLSADDPFNTGEIPGFAQLVSEGKASFRESSPLRRDIEVCFGLNSYKLMLSRENENSDFWKITRKQLT